MLSAGGHGLRSALLPAFKEGGRRVASDSGNGAPAYYGYGSAAWRLSPTQPDPTRALNALRTALLEGGDLRNLWAAAKARARAVLSTTAVSADSAGSSCHAAAARARRSGTIPAASLAPLYGNDGPLRWLIMYALAHGSRAFMTRANNTSVQGAEHMAAALARPAGTPLITVCNHVASMDDPLVMSTILPPQLYAQPGDLRCVRETHSMGLPDCAKRQHSMGLHLCCCCHCCCCCCAYIHLCHPPPPPPTHTPQCACMV